MSAVTDGGHAMHHDLRPGAGRAALTFLIVFLIMFFVPLIPYGVLSALAGLEPPAPDAPGQFMASVAIVKVGMAAGFISIFLLGRRMLTQRWLAYAGAWWAMYAVVEVGQALGPGYSWLEAGGGIVAEAIYFPLSAWLVQRMLGSPDTR